MIRIKAVDAQNILDACELTTNQDPMHTTAGGCPCCNAISIAEASYNSEMHPNVIYSNNVLIGFFMYTRAENQPDTATICRFMVDDRFQQKGLEEKALAHILRGLRIQGVKKVIIIINNANTAAKALSLSLGFHPIDATDKAECRYALEL